MSVYDVLKNNFSRYPIFFLARRKAYDLGIVPKEPFLFSDSFLRTRKIFVHIPKCAGNAITQSIYGKSSIEIAGHTTAIEMRESNNLIFLQSFKFTVVRNPVDRFVSAFYFLKAGGMNDADQQWARAFLSDGLSLDDFVEKMQGRLFRNCVLSYQHFQPQHTFICDENDSIIVDAVIRQETLSTDFQKLCLDSGLRGALKVVNKTIDKEDVMVSKSTVAKIRNIYQKDFSILSAYYG